MPAGLDGNPVPVRTPERTAVLQRVAAEVTALVEARPSGCVLVAVDGRSGSGKSTFADELARLLAEDGRRCSTSPPIPPSTRIPAGGARPILVFDGLFLHRPELRSLVIVNDVFADPRIVAAR